MSYYPPVKKPRTHEENQVKHIRRRAKKRFGLSLNRNGRLRLKEAILAGDTLCLPGNSNAKKRHILMLKIGENVICATLIYDKNTHRLVTIRSSTRKESKLLRASKPEIKIIDVTMFVKSDT